MTFTSDVPTHGAKRALIVNADDFGQSPGINHGVIEAHAHGIVTSASLMVRWPAAAAAAEYARAHPELSVGLHVDLGEWLYRAATWVPLYQVVDTNDRDAVAAQVEQQLESFVRLLGQPPTHLDSHQHVHRKEPTRSLLLAAAQRLGIPVRQQTPGLTYCNGFYGQTATGLPLPDCIGVPALQQLIVALPEGITELGCHPGKGADVDGMYRYEREREVQTLCDPRVRATLGQRGVRLTSFRLTRDWWNCA
jgi:predicted glycoside hydrolase/deacetylase ChbG (UPF0249 family)